MPALPPVAQVCKVIVQGEFAPTIWENIFHLQFSGLAPDAGALNGLAGQVLTAYVTNFAPLLNTAVAIQSCSIMDLTSPTAASGNATTTSAGSRVGSPNPASIACVISWAINLRYRGGHPRTYLPAGTNEDTINFTSWTQAFIAEATAAASSFHTAMNALVTGSTTYKLCIVSYRSGNAPRPQPLPFQIQGSSVDSRIDSQRRRLGKDRPS